MDRRTLLRATVVGAGTAALPFTAWSAAYAAPAQNAAGPYGPLAGRRRHRHPAPGRLHQPDRRPLAPDRPRHLLHLARRTRRRRLLRRRQRLDLRVQLRDQRRFRRWRLQAPLQLRPAPSRAPPGSCPAPTTTAPAARRPGTPGCPARRSASAGSGRPIPFGGTRRRPPAMGRFTHEAAAADPVRQVIYLTEDEPNGRFYRFVPTTWGNLSSGTLQVLMAGTGTSGSFTWAHRSRPRRLAHRHPLARSRAPSASTAAKAATTPTTPSGSPPRATTASGRSTSPPTPTSSPTTTTWSTRARRR